MFKMDKWGVIVIIVNWKIGKKNRHFKNSHNHGSIYKILDFVSVYGVVSLVQQGEYR